MIVDRALWSYRVSREKRRLYSFLGKLREWPGRMGGHIQRPLENCSGGVEELEKFQAVKLPGLQSRRNGSEPSLEAQALPAQCLGQLQPFPFPRQKARNPVAKE